MSGTPKILIIDIETTPNMADVWGLYNQTIGINQLRESTRMFAFAAKWYGESKIHFYSEYHHGRDIMIASAYELICTADIVVHFNGQSFDMPHLRREFLVEGYPPFSPVQQVDLMRECRKHFRFTSNKLDYITKYLGLSGKIHHTGHELWQKCMAGDPKAWALMRKYNRQDVKTTEELYDKILPWIDHPNLALLAADGQEHCSNCNSTDLAEEGHAYTKKYVYKRYRCRDCGKWNRGGKQVYRVDLGGMSV